ncbi:MAG: hypothetical protein CVT59_08725 [Actinobacteria bacterium HGW-Actinobacteria-1]|nr:MAG: hypothetical protein CVT59_08725 [Actinobacteria bacterium HGW-Actinobacteria-1]
MSPDTELDRASEPAPRRRSLVNQRSMVAAILVTIIVILAAVAVIVLYGLNMSRAPRTAVERALATAEVATRQQPGVASNWVDLTYAYIASGRYADARRASASGKVVGDLPAFYIADAFILEKQGNLTEAIAGYEAAKQKAISYHDELVSAAAAKGVIYSALNEDLADAAIYKARLLVETGDAASAVQEYDIALKIDPQMADVLVERAGARETIGDVTGARADYTAALRFIPDLQEAIDGLERLGAAQ